MGKIKRARARRRDLEQVYGDLSTVKSREKLLNQPLDEDKPGLGQFYCLECAKYHETQHALVEHRRGKNHKRRVRLLKEPPYTQQEAEFAAGIGTYHDLTETLHKRQPEPSSTMAE